MNKAVETERREVGRDNPDRTPKAGRSPIAYQMSQPERDKIIAALAYANEKTGFFRKK